MKIKNASGFFSSLQYCGLLKYILPEMSACVHHSHGKHHIEDVFQHMMFVGDNISTKFPILKLSGYLHDIGKPKSYDPMGEHFYEHHDIGSELLNSRLLFLRFSNKEIRTICGLTNCHMNLFFGNDKSMSPKSVRKTLIKFENEGISVSDFLRLRISDIKGNLRRNNINIISELRRYLVAFKQCNMRKTGFGVNDLAIKGGEIIKEFSLTPSPIIGDIQRQLVDLVIEHGEIINTKEQLIKIIEGILEKNNEHY